MSILILLSRYIKMSRENRLRCLPPDTHRALAATNFDPDRAAIAARIWRQTAEPSGSPSSMKHGTDCASGQKGQTPSERLATRILVHEGFTKIDPSHPLGGKGGGKDAIASAFGILRNGTVVIRVNCEYRTGGAR